MRIYIEYFIARNSDISGRLKKLMTPVKFRPIMNLSRIGYGVLECGDSSELNKVKNNLIDCINEELSEESFIEKIKTNKPKNDRLYDPIMETDIDIFRQKSSYEILQELGLEGSNE